MHFESNFDIYQLEYAFTEGEFQSCSELLLVFQPYQLITKACGATKITNLTHNLSIATKKGIIQFLVFSVVVSGSLCSCFGYQSVDVYQKKEGEEKVEAIIEWEEQSEIDQGIDKDKGTERQNFDPWFKIGIIIILSEIVDVQLLLNDVYDAEIMFE